MKYKGKKINRHRFRQLQKAKENHKKFMESIEPKWYVHPKTLENFKKLMEEE